MKSFAWMGVPGTSTSRSTSTLWTLSAGQAETLVQVPVAKLLTGVLGV